MLVDIENILVASAWQDSFKDRETGELVEYRRVLLVPHGEEPLQVGISDEDYPAIVECIGKSGTVRLDIQAAPGRRARISCKGMI